MGTMAEYRKRLTFTFKTLSELRLDELIIAARQGRKQKPRSQRILRPALQDGTMTRDGIPQALLDLIFQ